MFADVIVDITHEKLDRVFQYGIPTELVGVLKVGMEVVAPFGNGNRIIKGYVVGISDTANYDEDKIKDIIEIASQGEQIEARLVALAAWMKETYGGTMIQALKTVMPVKQKMNEKQRKYISLAINQKEAAELLAVCHHKKYKAKAKLLEALLEEDGLDYDLVTKTLHISLATIKNMEKQGSVQVESEVVYRNPLQEQARNKKQLSYTQEQLQVIGHFCKEYEEGVRKAYLLHGVTGSGKTEVYMEMIEAVVREGRQAIVLIPEISLTYQTVKRFCRTFGNRVSIMNSRLSKGERYDQWVRAKNGEIDVMIGPRSALFTPFPQLGLIVIDEEHEQTYKSEQIPRFHARETAIHRAEIEEASVVLGSATPSMEAYYRAKIGRYELLELKNRSRMQQLPMVEIVDLRAEMREGNRSIIGRRLHQLMEEKLEKKEQIMLFINRRGYASFVCCRSCGYVQKCPHCDVALSEHKGGKLVCHYCGYETEKNSKCPECDSPHIGGFRAGTQQIEMMVAKEFPDARILRMDMDTTKEKDSYENILSAFANEEADILIGTQMIVKGHDFPNVTLVGVLAADLSLYMGDYRASERTFQLLTQAAGRAGRGEKEGYVVIQTYSPENESIITASKQDYIGFYEKEIEYRELMGYPPAEHLMAILMQSGNQQLLETGANYTLEFIKKVDKHQNLQLIGPATPHVEKINNIYRRVIYLKAPNYDMLIDVKNKLEQYIEINVGFRNIRVQFDFEPMNLW